MAEAPARPAADPQRRWPPPALGVAEYRWFWLAQWPALLGLWMQVVALGYLVYATTHSTLAVGVVAAADGLPAVLLSLAGGVLADRHRRRRILLVTQSLLGLEAGALAVLVGTGRASFAVIVVVAALMGATDAIDLPARQALIADLVRRELVLNAVALGSIAMSTTRIVGPSVAGLLIAVRGPAVCFGFLAVAYAGPVLVLLLVVQDRPAPERVAGRNARTDLVAGLSAARRDPVVRGIVLAASALSLLGVSYMPYLPVLASTKLGGGSQVLGLLYSTGGIGGLVAGVAIASLRRTASRGTLLFGGGGLYAVSLFTVAHSTVLWLTLPGLVGISLSFMAMNTSMTTLLQTETDPAMRGRLLGLYATILAGLQPLGTLLYGLAGHVVPLFDAIGVGGVIVGAVSMAVARQAAFRRPIPSTTPLA